MKTLENIYDETEKRWIENNSQSSRSIAIDAMSKAVEEIKEKCALRAVAFFVEKYGAYLQNHHMIIMDDKLYNFVRETENDFT
jgi:hypothetical protein